MPSLEAFLKKLDDFLAAMEERGKHLPLAIESRNKNYLTAEYYASEIRSHQKNPPHSMARDESNKKE